MKKSKRTYTVTHICIIPVMCHMVSGYKSVRLHNIEKGDVLESEKAFSGENLVVDNATFVGGVMFKTDVVGNFIIVPFQTLLACFERIVESK